MRTITVAKIPGKKLTLSKEGNGDSVNSINSTNFSAKFKCPGRFIIYQQCTHILVLKNEDMSNFSRC